MIHANCCSELLQLLGVGFPVKFRANDCAAAARVVTGVQLLGLGLGLGLTPPLVVQGEKLGSAFLVKRAVL